MESLDYATVLPITVKYILLQIDNVEAKLKQNSLALASLDSDGDTMDDNTFRALRTERELLEGELNFLKRISTNEVLKSPDLTDASITIGHTVKIKIVYPEGVAEQINLSIVSSLDKRYLPKDLAFTPDHVLASVDTPVVKAILGKKARQNVEYNTEAGTGSIRIIAVGISSLFNMEV